MTLAAAIRDSARALRRAHALRRLAPGVVAALAALAIAAWMSRLGWGGAAAWTVLGWLAALAAAVAAAALARRGLRRLAPPDVAAALERRGAWRRGALTTLLDPLAPGTSADLHAAAARQETTRVSAEAAGLLADDVRAEHRRAMRMLAWGGVALLMLVLAHPLEGAAAMLWSPWRAVRALVAPVRVSSAVATVDRGEHVRLEIEALGQRRATLLLRAPGEPWREVTVELDDAGHASYLTDPLEAELVARVTAGGRASRELRVAVRLPAFLGALTVTARYPRYLALENEQLPVDGDTLVIPEGTELVVEGRATMPIANARLVSPAGAVPFVASGEGFGGAFTPAGDGEWRLEVSPAQGGSLEGMPGPIRIRVVPDSAPVVTIPIPGADTVASPSRRLPLVVAVEDDHGVRSAAIEHRRGAAGVAHRLPLPVGPESGDRALVSVALDLDSLGLAPGDTLRYLAVATDNAPRVQRGRSREFLLVVPTEAEQRAARSEATDVAENAFDSLATLARRAQRQADDLARERARSESGRGADPTEPMSADAARRAEQAAEAQQEVERRLGEMQRDIAELERGAEREGLADSALARQLGEIRELLERAMTPELRDAMERLRESLQDLDAERTRDALRDLAAQQERMRQAIERARELFERAALETELANLAQEAKELLERQRAAETQLQADSAAGAQTEERLADRADSLAGALDRAAAEVPAEATQEGLQQAADQSRQAAGEMRRAAESARNGRRQQAQRQAQSAGEALEPLEQQIRDRREELQEAMQQEVLDALDRLLAETSRLQARQYGVAESLRRGAMAGPLRAEETMLEEATAKLLQQVIAVSGKNALVSPRISVALAAARDGMRAAIGATSAASPSLGLAADRAGEAVDALSVAAYSLMQSRQAVSNAESGTGLEEAMQQMQQMAGRQGELSDQGQSMLQQGMPQDMAMMMQMAMQQRAIAQQLERMRAQGQMPGAGEFAREAQELSRALEQGRLSAETIERQERLFRRMLDAGRSLQGEEEDERKERQSESARDGELAPPEALDPRLLRGNAFPLPGWEELQRLSPDDRRRVLDYFRRLAEGAQPR